MRILKSLIIIITVIIDIYILGVINLFNPLIYGIIFVVVNYSVYYFCYKKDKTNNYKVEGNNEG